jgi:hypothetical protein
MLSAWGLLRDPTAHFRGRRAAWGDTFVVDAAGHRLLCVFSPEGIRSLYGFAECDASFGLATFELIRRKVPDELFAGQRNTPHDLFGRQETERYLGALDEAVTFEIDELGPEGRFEVLLRVPASGPPPRAGVVGRGGGGVTALSAPAGSPLRRTRRF